MSFSDIASIYDTVQSYAKALELLRKMQVARISKETGRLFFLPFFVNEQKL